MNAKLVTLQLIHVQLVIHWVFYIRIFTNRHVCLSVLLIYQFWQIIRHAPIVIQLVKHAEVALTIVLLVRAIWNLIKWPINVSRCAMKELKSLMRQEVYVFHVMIIVVLAQVMWLPVLHVKLALFWILIILVWKNVSWIVKHLLIVFANNANCLALNAKIGQIGALNAQMIFYSTTLLVYNTARKSMKLIIAQDSVYWWDWSVQMDSQ
jgi:hypothetical protein